MSEAHGVVFPQVDGRRSTSATGRSVVADALRGVDPIGAAAVERETNWRRGYVEHFGRLVVAELTSEDAAGRIAADALTSLAARLQWSGPDGVRPIDHAFDSPVQDPLGTEVVTGSGERVASLSIPYRGARLAGDGLRRQLAAWVAAGVIEPSAQEAVCRVLDHPQWLDLSGRTVVVLGAAADLPRPAVWQRVLDEAGHGAGRVHVPVTLGKSGNLADRAGGDLIQD